MGSATQLLRVQADLLREANPGQTLAISDGVRRCGQRIVSEAAACDTDRFGGARQEPKQRRAAVGAEVALLVLVLCFVVKGVNLGLTTLLDHGSFVEVGRDSEHASRSPLAVRAVADAMHGWQCVDRD